MSSASPPLAGSSRSDRAFYLFTAIASAAALSVIAWLLLFRRGATGGPDLSFMPAVNASLNATASVLLASGWIAIRRGARNVHKRLMVASFAVSGLFLVGYLAYHYVHGDTRYPADAPFRIPYLVILATHVILSIPILPAALLAFWFAARGRFDRHVRITRVLLPAWLYVSVTGVLIFFLLRSAYS